MKREKKLIQKARNDGDKREERRTSHKKSNIRTSKRREDRKGKTQDNGKGG